MFEYAESDPALTDDEATSLIPGLRTQLLKAQYQHLQKKDRALLILVGGIDGAGKGDTVNLLNEWMDPRHIQTMAFPPATKDERAYPPLYRFWLNLPPKGNTGIVFGSGYAPLIKEAAKKHPNAATLEKMMLTARRYEADLVANGIQVIKLWFHLSRDAQKARVKNLQKNPSTAWKVSPDDHTVSKRFKRLRKAAQRVIEATDADHAPWIIIPAANENMRNLSTARAVLAALKQRSVRVPALHDPAAELPVARRSHNPLDDIDYTDHLAKDDYDTALLHWQNRLAEAVRHPKFLKHHALMLVFEGQDAAGKGSTIRRITKALDARQYQILPVSAPKQFELDRPYLWRFWRAVPRHGRIAIFDRSWYGRVLVERVEKLITRPTWQRAYTEINAFEQQLSQHGVLIIKFWLAITPDEQLRRFESREELPFKQYKITDEDWRNRDKWQAYRQATSDMLMHTDSPHAHWHPISANDKRHARIAVMKQIVNTIESAIDSATATGKDR
jgi:polyphosphate:AMP phosphotransferase